MRFARTILISATLLASFAASAQTPVPSPAPVGEFASQTGGGPRFEAAKQKHLARLDLYISCVRQSTTFEAMRACRPHQR